MGTVYIDSVQTRIVNISDIVDSLSANESTFTIDLLGYTTSNKLGSLVEVYGFTNNLLAIGNARKEIVKIGVRPRTSLEIVGYSAFLNWYPITGRFTGSLRNVIESLIIAAQMDNILLGTRFLTSEIARDTEISVSFDYQFLGQAIQQCLGLSGYPLTYRIPISEKIIEINQPGYGNFAPIPVLNLDDLYTNCGLGITRPIQYSKIPPIASKIIVYGRNGLRTIGNGSVIPLDIVRYTSKGENQFNTLKTADELIKVLVTQPTITGNCTMSTEITSSNNIDFLNEAFEYDYTTNSNIFSGASAELVLTTEATNIKASSNISYLFEVELDTAYATMTITFNNQEIHSSEITGFLDTVVVSLAEFEGQSGEIVTTFNLPENAKTFYAGYIAVDCCAIDTIVGIGENDISADNTPRLEAAQASPQAVKKHPDGTIYFTDTANFRLRKIDENDNIVTVAGSGNPLGTPINGGVATEQDLGQIHDFVIVSNEEKNVIYLLVPDFPQVGKLDLDTGLYYVIDTDFTGFAKRLNGITADNDGNIYYSYVGNNADNNVIYKLTADETTRSIFAGVSGTDGFSGDGGIATDAQLDEPSGLDCDTTHLYFADLNNNRIRKVNFDTGIISTIAGNNFNPSNNLELDIDALEFSLDSPFMCCVDRNTSDVYTSLFDIILKIDGTTNIITRVCSTGIEPGIDNRGDTGSPLTSFIAVSQGDFFNISGHIVSITEIYLPDPPVGNIRKVYCGVPPNPLP